jgi:hypothetical protein
MYYQSKVDSSPAEQQASRSRAGLVPSLSPTPRDL